MKFTKNQLEPTLDLTIKVLQGLTSVPGSEIFIPRQSLFNEQLVLKFLLNDLYDNYLEEAFKRFDQMQD
jgi:hypothetical protein